MAIVLPPITWAAGAVMLQKLNQTIAYYLECASLAHERARFSDCKEVREFHERMVERWMNFAADSAWAEGVDLFIESMSVKVPPVDLCNKCYQIMRLMITEIAPGRERLMFKCTLCGAKKVRDLPSCSTKLGDKLAS